MAVNLVINFEVKLERLGSFREIMKSVKTSLPAVDGCRGVRVFNSVDKPHTFTLVETWDSTDLHAEHFRKVVGSGQWRTIVDHLSAEPTSGYFTEI